jgi:hypothetical protein
MRPLTAALADPLSGEAVCWDTPEGLVPVARIRAALAAAGLDEKALRAMHKRHAFLRALADFKKSRLVRPLADTADALVFQFTREEKAGDTLEYTFDDKVRLDKLTGAITAADPELAARAKALFDRADGGRTGADISRLVQRLFQEQGDLFAIRKRGGFYYVPAARVDFVDKVQRFLEELGGGMGRLPVTSGTAQGDATTRDAIADGMARLLADYRAKVAEYTSDTRPAALERSRRELDELEFKVECYAVHLDDRRAELDAALAATREAVRARLFGDADGLAPDMGRGEPAGSLAGAA